jgi:hypothetical protein
MAHTRKPRDYKAEAARRDVKARSEGFRSYGVKRKVLERAKQLSVLQRDQFIAAAPTLSIPQQKKYIEGANAVRSGDHRTADRIATQLQLSPAGNATQGAPPGSAFWYHP